MKDAPTFSESHATHCEHAGARSGRRRQPESDARRSLSSVRRLCGAVRPPQSAPHAPSRHSGPDDRAAGARRTPCTSRRLLANAGHVRQRDRDRHWERDYT
ncbi:hypothetical protein EVAR_99989_1 [Eumeta japonica]|uniref:Uncharacterized protein n=1 Tax=Eumeta variegata TaxID=151549 RepID=A0A4C1ZKM6_EUMVA|nr:hypothetical protein EVAR_99989_1 [Eumeta japonica]